MKGGCISAGISLHRDRKHILGFVLRWHQLKSIRDRENVSRGRLQGVRPGEGVKPRGTVVMNC